VLSEPSAVIDGRAALVLAHVLARCLHNRAPLRTVLSEMKVAPDVREAVLAAELALEEAGERWRIGELARKQRAAISSNAETSGNGSVVASRGDGDRLHCRVRQLAAAGELPGVLTSRGWTFERADVIAYRDSNGAKPCH
jgi:hypothetical protein